jgi:hypothetical protein
MKRTRRLVPVWLAEARRYLRKLEDVMDLSFLAGVSMPS